ncbi:MAG: hypothetical protein L3J28_02100 [Candidatus Polarisedimenticolaceae bacterium]|nr:hypothetical protein [Candidatus Polarisedimenticolaceae bacterium]
MNNSEQLRHRHYVDRVLQGWFLVGLVTLEVLLFGVGLFIIYQNMNEAIELQIFQAHAPHESGSSLLLYELMSVLPWILVANVIAVLITSRIWSQYLEKVIRSLRQMLAMGAKLDFRDVSDQMTGSHEVLDIGAAWMTRERDRNRIIKTAIAELTVDTDPEEALRVLDRVKAVLK